MKPLSNYRTLVIGARGFIGGHLLSYYRQHDPDCIGTHTFAGGGLYQLNLEEPTQDLLNLPLTGYRYALIAGGIGNPIDCEVTPEKSWKINVQGTLTVCRFFARKNIQPILISSGYVFDGIKGQYVEDTPYSPINVYGLHKAELEKKALGELRDECLIVRIAKIFGFTKGDRTLMDEIVALLYQKKEVLAARDQIFSPISIDDVIQSIVALQSNGCRGIYHLGTVNPISRFELAQMVVGQLKMDEKYIKPISLEDINASFRRPKRSDLVPDKLLSHTNVKMAALEESIERIVSNYV